MTIITDNLKKQPQENVVVFLWCFVELCVLLVIGSVYFVIG